MGQSTVDESDLEWWLQVAPLLEWTWAKTYADSAPHWYIVEGRTPIFDHSDYLRASRVIRRFGQPGRFWRSTNIYLTDPTNTWKWWIMGTSIEDGTLINRAEAQNTYGPQDAPSTKPKVVAPSAQVYDQIGPDYDAMWTKPSDVAENEAVRSIIVRHFGAYAPSTLDIGCGTGLLLDLGITSPSIYTGVDPSQGMLNELILKHPTVAALHAETFEESLPRFRPGQFDLVASLFAPISYIDPKAIAQIPKLARSLVFLMNYNGVWLPDWYNGVEPPSVGPARAATRALLDDYEGEALEIGAFEVTVLRP